MTRKTRVRVIGRFDRAFPTEATVTIDKHAGLVSVRPFRRRREFILPLSRLAEYVVHTVIRAEHAEKSASKKRKVRRGLL